MVFQNDILAGASGASGSIPTYSIDQSIRFNDDDSAHLVATLGSASDGDKFTISAWVKRGNLGTDATIFSGGTSSSNDSLLKFETDNTLRFYDLQTSFKWNYITTALFRDPSAWYHIVAVVDLAGETTANRVKIYVNGVRITSFSTESQAPLFMTPVINSAVTHAWGRDEGNDNQYFDGYIAEMNFVDGLALTPTSFGETNDDGVWIPKAYSGAYGNNGFFIDGRDSSDLGDDESGNGNDFTSSGLAADDQVVDTPTDNYATLNPLNTVAPVVLSNGNLSGTYAGGAYQTATSGTISVNSGKWYWEVNVATVGASYIGLALADIRILGLEGTNTTFNSGDAYVYGMSGHKFNGFTAVAYGATYTSGDVVGVAFDADAGTLTFYKNNSSQGVAYTGLTSGPYMFIDFLYSGAVHNVNFGQLGFTYTPPTGFSALSTANLPTPTITDGSTAFQTTLYTGNGTAIGSGGLAVSQSENSTFQPDLVWIKRRNSTVQHALTDAVRGVTKELNSDAFTAESTVAEGLTTFGSAGFTVGSDASYNTSSAPYVAWQWKANGSGSSNEDGSINTTATSVNTAAGISIMTYVGNATAGATIGHGLGKKPGLVIAKTRNSGQRWWVYHEDQGATKYGILELSNAFVTSSLYWNNTEPTDTLISLGSGLTNMSGINMLAYAFTEIPGFSKIGAYTGNGNANGAFIHTGFQPAWLMIKRTNSTSSWGISDTKRLGYNVDNDFIMADTVAAEVTYDYVDLLSNGFKIRNSGTAVGVSGSNYVYMAFAEHPFGGDGVAPATAR